MEIIEINPAVRKAVEANDGYCPCMIEKTPDTKCMCKDFREQNEPGPCHCGRFLKVADVPDLCPFCGGEAKLNVYPFESRNEYQVECTNCFSQSAVYDSEQEAIAAWDRRSMRDMQKETQNKEVVLMGTKEVNLKLADIPAGECFRVGNHELVVLEHCAGVTRTIRKELYKENAHFGANNNFSGANMDELCCRFAEELKALVGEENLVEHEVDLTSDDGLKDYGTVSRLASLLTAEQYRRYVDILDRYKLDKWWWLVTPYSTPRHANDYWVKCVAPSGYIYCVSYGYHLGVRPFCIFKSDIFVSR